MDLYDEIDLTLPVFLDRKLNGYKPEPLPGWAKRAKAAPKLVMPKTRIPKADRDSAVKVYFPNPYRGISCGWHTVIVVKEDVDDITIRQLDRERGVTLPFTVWDKLQKKELTL